MNFENEEVKRIRRAFHDAAPSHQPRPDCPQPDEIWAGVRDDLAPDQLSPLLRHLASCPVCTESWRLAQQISEESDQDSDPMEEPESELREMAASPAHSGKPAPTGWLRWAGIAAGFIMVLAAGYFWTIGSQMPDSALRAPGQATLTLETTSCTPQDCQLQWQALPEAEYDVRLTTPAPDFETIFEMKGVQQASLHIPFDSFQDIKSGTPLQVRIAALRQGEGQIASETFTIMLQ